MWNHDGSGVDARRFQIRRSTTANCLLSVLLLLASCTPATASLKGENTLGGAVVNPTPLGSSPSTLPTLPWHLTARPWRPAYMNRAVYLDVVESIARFEAKYQTSTGAIIDPYTGAEEQYQTPYFAASVAILVSAGRALDLLPKGVLAMDRATWEIANGLSNIPDNHGEFFLAPLAKALPLYAPHVPLTKFDTWSNRLRTSISQIIRGIQIENWRTYAMKGEWLRASQGLVDLSTARDWIENSWLNTQKARFTADNWNLYHDMTSDPDTLVYEAVARSNLFAMLRAGYDGPSRSEMESLIERGTQTALLMQEPSGQNPASGRSAGHTWNDVLAGNIFEQMAEHVYSKGTDNRLAGQYRHAAMLNILGIERWKRTDGSYSVTKNHLDPKEKLGYASYSYFNNYNGNVMFHAAESYQHRESNIEEHPVPAEIGGYTFETDTSFANAFANAGGMMMQVALRGSTAVKKRQYWTALGAVRFGRVGWDSRLGPSDGKRSVTSGLGVSFAPTFLENNSWVRLASVPERYEGKFSTQFTHPLLVRCAIDYVPKAGQTGPTFRDEFVITPDGILSKLSSTAPTFGITWPILENDGKPLSTSYLNNIASVSFPGGSDQQNFIALQPAATLDQSEEVVGGSYGYLRPVRVTVPGVVTNDTFIYPRSGTDPLAEEVRNSFVSKVDGFSSILGRVEGTLYVGRTSAGGFGQSIDLNGDGVADVTFNLPCGFILQLHNGTVTAIETDSAVIASVQGRNVALAAYSPVSFAVELPVTPLASSFQIGNPPENALDVSYSTRWSASGIGQWLSLDLEEVKGISTLQLAWYLGDSRTAEFDIESSIDGITWDSIVKGVTSSGSTLSLETYPLGAISARFLRVVNRGNSSNQWMSITEAKVNGWPSLSIPALDR